MGSPVSPCVLPALGAPLAIDGFNRGSTAVSNRIALVLVVAVMSMASSVALAAPSCSVWLFQSENYYWQQCVYDDGSRKCFRGTDDSGSNSQEISC